MAGFVFDVVPPDVDEVVAVGEVPEDAVVRLAGEKADAVLGRVPPTTCVLACDTIVVLDGEILGKPGSTDEAVAMLLRLAGRSHRVLTGYVVAAPSVDGDGAGALRGVDESVVTMHPVSVAEATAYAHTGEPMDKAGAYALQGEGKRFVGRVDGLRSNVVGLPLEVVVPILASFGIHRHGGSAPTGGTPHGAGPGGGPATGGP
jgi:septum formation protein